MTKFNAPFKAIIKPTCKPMKLKTFKKHPEKSVKITDSHQPVLGH